MCGILGIINFEKRGNEWIREAEFQELLNTLSHRGPDTDGIYIDEQIAFGHRRLSILDLSEKGKQPMKDVQNRVLITFNGEIYNYQEIRQKLQSKGYSFKSNTDTEVILNAYLAYGKDCLSHFNGMFAFAIYDEHEQEIFIARDRIGIKPLYYSEVDGQFLFASEPKAILGYRNFSTSYSLEAISSYFSFRYVLGGSSFFENIEMLQPGHCLTIDLKSQKKIIEQYYELPINVQKEDLGEEYYIQKVKEEFDKAVKYRMISDVKVGAYLSGGLDSSAVVANMSKYTQDLTTFTIGFKEEGYNEFQYSKQVADLYKTNHHALLMNPTDYWEDMNTLIAYKDAPLGVANEPALYRMSKELKKHFTVVLSGEGSDEIFGGYGRIFRSAYDYERVQNGGLSNPDFAQAIQQKYKKTDLGSELDHFMNLYQYIDYDTKKQFFSAEFLNKLPTQIPFQKIWETNFAKLEGLPLTEKMMWMFEKIHIVGLLQRVDVTTMATGVEARVPFVDHKFLEFVMSIPLKYRLKWKNQEGAKQLISDKISEEYDIPKYLLKKAFEKDLPNDVVWRKKMGFPVPVHAWFGQDFNKIAHDLLLDDTARQRGLYNTSFLEKALKDEKLFTQHAFGLKIWMLVNLELWLRKYFK